MEVHIMLVKLSIENFLSFENETELSMIPSNKTRKKSEHKIKIKSTDILKHAVIYGANASGKSNLIEAFQFIKHCVVKSIPTNATTMFCKSKKENEKKPSTFELQFSLNEKFYAYGFSLVLSERKVVSEWLYELFQNGSSKALFERESGCKPVVGKDVSLTSADNSKLQTYLEDFDESGNSLFITFMNQGKKYNPNTKLSFFKEIYTWINESLTICTPQTSLTSFEYYYDQASLTRINELIKVFDTGISEVNIEEITLEELQKELPVPVYDNLMSELKNKIEIEGLQSLRVSMRSSDSFFNIEFVDKNSFKVTTIKLKHGPSFYHFNFKEESDGTRRLFELLDILLTKSDNKVYVIDEMERSLHPKLTSKFIELFEIMHPEQKVQLIFTTHESSIMDQELFRRDEIWFVERDKNNNSTIYSLDIFKERYDKKLSKAYLEGRYGAIPVFTSFTFKED